MCFNVTSLRVVHMVMSSAVTGCDTPLQPHGLMTTVDVDKACPDSNQSTYLYTGLVTTRGWSSINKDWPGVNSDIYILIMVLSVYFVGPCF